VHAERHDIGVYTVDVVTAPGFGSFGGEAADVGGAAAASELAEALELLRVHAPAYLRWVDAVVRAVIPVTSGESELRSASDPAQPGVVQVSLGCGPIALAEMLVHEASHQHYHLLSRLGAVANGLDRTQYYSPFRKTHRPIDALLVTYHAFANVVLFYRQCQRAGVPGDGGECVRAEAAILPRTLQIESALVETKGLTALGDALWEPLHAALREG